MALVHVVPDARLRKPNAAPVVPTCAVCSSVLLLPPVESLIGVVCRGCASEELRVPLPLAGCVCGRGGKARFACAMELDPPLRRCFSCASELCPTCTPADAIDECKWCTGCEARAFALPRKRKRVDVQKVRRAAKKVTMLPPFERALVAEKLRMPSNSPATVSRGVAEKAETLEGDESIQFIDYAWDRWRRKKARERATLRKDGNPDWLTTTMY